MKKGNLLVKICLTLIPEIFPPHESKIFVCKLNLMAQSS